MQLLIDKFESVSITEDGLSEEDLSFCKNRQASYDRAVQHLAIRRELLSKLHDEFDSLTRDSNVVDKYIPTRNSDMNAVDEIEHSLKYQLTHEVLFHFREAHSLQIPYPSELIKEGVISVTDDFAKVIRELRTYLGGVLVFSDHTRDAIIETFKKTLWSDTEIRGSKVRLSYRYIVENCRYTGHNLLYHSSDLAALKHALSLFETETVMFDTRFDALVPRATFDFNQPLFLLPAFGCSGGGATSTTGKVKGLRYYKNSRVDVLFNSTEAADSFVSYFDLKVAR